MGVMGIYTANWDRARFALRPHGGFEALLLDLLRLVPAREGLVFVRPHDVLDRC
jgi:hypothetical protein